MSTAFNQPTPPSIGLPRVEGGEGVNQDTGESQQKPSPEKVTPTQQGKFLSALENKIEPASSETEESSTGIFGLSGKPKEKPSKALSSGTGEKGQQQGQPLAIAPTLPIVVNEQVGAAVEKGVQVQPLGAAADITPKTVNVYAPLAEEGSVETPAIQTLTSPTPVVPAAPQTPVQGGPVAAPVQKGPVAAPVQKGPATQQAVSQLAEGSEKKERVAFQSTPTKKVDVPVTPAIQITPQPEITITPQPSTQGTAAAQAALIELFNQTVDAVATFATSDTTTTVVTVKYPPIFEGTSIVVTEYSSAPKQYNITFSNLSPDARRLIEASGSETQLRQALIDKGYTLHMMTIESQPLTTQGTETATPEGEGRGQFSEKGGGGAGAGEEGAGEGPPA